MSELVFISYKYLENYKYYNMLLAGVLIIILAVGICARPTCVDMTVGQQESGFIIYRLYDFLYRKKKVITLTCLYFFKPVTIVLGGTKEKMQQWCPCKIVLGELALHREASQNG